MIPRKRVLIVDDEADFTSVTAMALEGTGRFKVQQENRAAHALDAARAFHPELILLDVMMPEKDGGDVLAELECDPDTRHIPVVFLTALVTNSESPVGSLSRGGRQYLPKPMSLECLAKTIDGVLVHAQHPASTAGPQA